MSNDEFKTFLSNKSGKQLLENSRGMSFGGAGASLAIILLIAQIGVSNNLVTWALVFASLSFPFWMSLALTYDIWHSFCLEHRELSATKWLLNLQAIWFFTTSAFTFISISLLIFSMKAFVGFIFVLASLIGLVFFTIVLVIASLRLSHQMEEARCESTSQ